MANKKSPRWGMTDHQGAVMLTAQEVMAPNAEPPGSGLCYTETRNANHQEDSL
jgi:hypothetical protein